MKVYQIYANLVHRELRNATFEGEKNATSIKMPDSVNLWFLGVWSILEDCETLKAFTQMPPEEFSIHWLPSSASGTKVKSLTLNYRKCQCPTQGGVSS